MAATFEEVVVPSTRHPSGAWRVTRCFDNGVFAGVDLGWRDDLVDYRNIGNFAHETEAMAAIAFLEDGGSGARELPDIMTAAGFERHQPLGLSTGDDKWYRDLGNGTSAWLQFDIDGLKAFVISTADEYVRSDVGTITLYTDGSRLAPIRQSFVVAIALLIHVVEKRIAAGTVMAPVPAA